MRRIVLATVAASTALLLTACGSGSGGGSSSSSASSSAAPSSSSASSSAAPTPFSGFLTADCAVAQPSTPVKSPPNGVTSGPITVTGDKIADVPTITTAGGAAPATKLSTVDIIEGNGTAVVASDTVKVNYCGVGQATGELFDSSWVRKEPVSFPLSGVIQGWSDGVTGMKVGGRRLLIIPADLAYGDTPPPGTKIQAGETLVFVVDLIAIGAETPSPTATPTAFSGYRTATCNKKEASADVATPPSGTTSGPVTVTGATVADIPTITIKGGAEPATSLTTVDIVKGSGTAATSADTVTVNYCGVGQLTGELFDSSWVSGNPATFPLQNVIKGWTDGVAGMQPGGRRLLIIPADQAYGDTPPDGSGIAPGETLVFVVDLIKIGA